MTEPEQYNLLRDHGDMRMVATDLGDPSAARNVIVQLNPDHPGFRDQEYRARRNAIAQIAADYKPGMPIPVAPYTPEEHLLWRIIRDALEPAHQQYAAAEYLECVRKLELPRDRIPQLHEVSEKVQALSGFSLEPISGLVKPRVFLESLADGVFLCTQYIRHHSTPDYTPEPDVVHEITGHAVTLASERLAELNRLVGEAVKRTRSTDALERLSRVYWFTIEFGVVREKAEVKAYGTGLLSSAGELEVMHHAELRPLDLEAASRQQYDPTKYQPVLFCADSFEEMYQALHQFLTHWK
jgi:phenylalanine-4-hydroxylase